MIYQATQAIADYLQKKSSLKYSIRDMGSYSFLEIRFGLKNCNDITLRFVSMDDDNDVKLLSAPIAKFPEDKLQKGYELLNKLSLQYQFFKFTIDDDGDLTVQYDFPISISKDCLGPIAFEFTVRAPKIIDDTYPEIMKAIWG